MAAQTPTIDPKKIVTKRDEAYRIEKDVGIASHVRNILLSYTDFNPVNVKTLSQFKDWREKSGHLEIPVTFWDLYTIAQKVHSRTEGNGKSTSNKNPQQPLSVAIEDGSEVMSKNPSQLEPAEVKEGPSELITSSFNIIPEPVRENTVPFTIAPPEIQTITPGIEPPLPSSDLARTDAHSIPTRSNYRVKTVEEKTEQKKAATLLSHTAPTNLAVANKYILPRVTRLALEKRLKTIKIQKVRLRTPKIRVITEETKNAEEIVEKRNRIYKPDDELSFLLLTPQSQAQQIKSDEKKDHELAIQRALGQSNPTEEQKEEAPNQPEELPTIPLEDVLQAEDQPEFALPVLPDEVQRVHLSASSDPVYRLFQETGFAAATDVFQKTGNTDDFIDRTLEWTHAFAQNFIKKARVYRKDDPVLDVVTTSPDSSLAPLFIEQPAGTPIEEHAFVRKTIPLFPGEDGEEMIRTEESDGYETEPSQPYTTDSDDQDNHEEENHSEDHSYGNNHSQSHSSYHSHSHSHSSSHSHSLQQTTNNSPQLPRGGKTLKKQARRLILNQLKSAPVKAALTNPYVLAGIAIAIILLLFFILIFHMSQGGDSIESRTAGEKAVTHLVVNKSGLKEIGNGGIVVDKITVNFGDENYQGRAQDITITDKFSDNAEVYKEGTTPYDSYDPATHTITWTADKLQPIGNLGPDGRTFSGMDISVALKPTQENTYVFDQATATVVGLVDPVAKTPGTGAGSTTGSSAPPSTNDCNGAYTSYMQKNTFLHTNFGDPTCNFQKSDLYKMLQDLDPNNADFFYFKIVKCESGYIPTNWASPTSGTPDPQGAWGLFQVGSSKPAGQSVEIPGYFHNDVNDRGDVSWQRQVVNAVNLGKGLKGGLAAYWACAR